MPRAGQKAVSIDGWAKSWAVDGRAVSLPVWSDLGGEDQQDQ